MDLLDLARLPLEETSVVQRPWMTPEFIGI